MSIPFYTASPERDAELPHLLCELLPLRYATYVQRQTCLCCSASRVDSKTYLVLGHPRRVDVSRLQPVTSFQYNLPHQVKPVAETTIPTCAECAGSAQMAEALLGLPVPPPPPEELLFQKAKERKAREEAAADTGASLGRNKKITLADL